MGYVIGICGPAGGGKSSLVRALQYEMPEASAVYIDDYQRITRQPMSKISQWRERGADLNEFTVPLISDHLQRLKSGGAVVDPLTLRKIKPAKYIFFETHFGRAHNESGQHIDYLVWIDVPADIALARNVRDLLKPMLPGGGHVPDQQRLGALDAYLVNYSKEIRQLRLLQAEWISPEADIIVDGSQTSEQLASQLCAQIRLVLP
jgi:uridine kinase